MSAKQPSSDRPELPFERKAHPMLRAARYTGAGLEFAAAVGLLTWLGWKGDERFGTDPWLTVAGALVGIATGTWILLRPFLGPPTRGGE